MRKHITNGLVILFSYVAPISALILTGSVGIEMLISFVSEQMTSNAFGL